MTDDDRTAAEPPATAAPRQRHGAAWRYRRSRWHRRYGTADSYGVGSVGYPDYASEPDYSDATGRTSRSVPAFRTADSDSTTDPADDSAHDAEVEANRSSEEQGYRGGTDDI